MIAIHRYSMLPIISARQNRLAIDGLIVQTAQLKRSLSNTAIAHRLYSPACSATARHPDDRPATIADDSRRVAGENVKFY